MNAIRRLSLVPVAAVALLAGCATSHMDRSYEYRVVRGVTHSTDLQEKLNKVGAEGFVVVSSQTLPEREGQQAITIVILQKGK